MGYTELTSGWQLTKSEFGLQGIRTFIWRSAIFSLTKLPVLGSSFFANSHTDEITELGKSNEQKHLICKAMDKSTLYGVSGDYLYTCYYSNEETDWTFYNSDMEKTLENFSYSMEFGGDFQCLIPNPDGLNLDWYFASDGSQIRNESLPFKVTTATLRLTRFIPDSKFDEFQASSLTYLGKVNGIKVTSLGAVEGNDWNTVKNLTTASNLFKNLPGCWLYNGFTSEPHYSLKPNKGLSEISNSETKMDFELYHRVEMTFLLRVPGDLIEANTMAKNGWLVILKNSGEWKEPTNGNRKIYEDCGSYSFAKLFK